MKKKKRIKILANGFVSNMNPSDFDSSTLREKRKNVSPHNLFLTKEEKKTMYNIVIFYFCVAVLWGENGISWIDIYNLLKMSEANSPMPRVQESTLDLFI